jgi:hypothetical protein
MLSSHCSFRGEALFHLATGNKILSSYCSCRGVASSHPAIANKILSSYCSCRKAASSHSATANKACHLSAAGGDSCIFSCYCKKILSSY